MQQRVLAVGLIGVLSVVIACTPVAEIQRGSSADAGVPATSTANLSTSTHPATPHVTSSATDVATVAPTFARAPQPASTPTGSTLGNVRVYVVQPGETLFRVALKFGMTIEALTKANNISDPTKIYAGQKLVIPGISTPQPTVASASRPDATRPVPPAPSTVNDVPVDRFVVMPDDVKQNIHQIYAQGLAPGNNPRAFSKIGDSTIQNPYFLTRFDGGPYNLGQYAYLQSVIDYFAGSFGREGMAVRKGLHSWTMLNPMWADKTQCQPNETPVGCEFRLHKPSLVLIRLGANDTGAPKLFRESMQKLVEFCVQQGVIPVLSTKADRREGPANVDNNIIRQLAAENHVPLWDFDLVAQTIPGRGLDVDGVHMTAFYAHDYTLPEAFQRGHSVNNLTALIMLDKLWKELTTPAP